MPTETIQLPKEAPKEKLRAYKIGENLYPSVTSVISYTHGLPAEMMNWVARNSILRALREERAALKNGKKLTQKELVVLGMQERHRLLKESQVKGTTIHTWAEEFLGQARTPTDIPKQYAGYWNSFLRFYEYFPIKAILQETVLFSHKYKYAGRMDFYGTLTRKGKDTRVLIDFKTSNAIRWEYGLQLAAYKECLETMGYPVDECYILHLRSGGFYDFVPFNKPLKLFLNSRELFEDKVRDEKPQFELALTPDEYLKKEV